VAVGMLSSSLTESQVIAFFVTFIVLAGLYWVGDLGALVGNVAGNVLQALSFKEHFVSFERGLIDTTDVLFFVSVAVLCLMFAFRALESRKWA